MTQAIEVEVPITITFKVGVVGGGSVREVEVDPAQAKLTVRDLLAANNIDLPAGHSVSVNGTPVDLDHEIDLNGIDPAAVPVVLVAPRVNNG